jgi:hypothetical protein
MENFLSARPQEQASIAPRFLEIDGWFEEKIINSLSEVARAIASARQVETLELTPKSFSTAMQDKDMLIEMVLSDLYASLFDLTKIAAKLRGFDGGGPEDAKEIFNNGERGLASVLDKYGLSDWLGCLAIRHFIFDNKGERIDVKAKFKRILELSQSSTRSNRTLIYLELESVKWHPLTSILLDAIEPVSQGEKSWTEFQKEAKEILKDFE